MNSRSSDSKGFVSAKALLGLASAGVLSFAWWVMDSPSSGEVEIEPLFEKVIKGEFKLEFTELGEIESAENVEIICEVKGDRYAGVCILEIVPEGSKVKKGDFLVRLDDALLQKNLLSQRILVHKARASLVKAKAEVQAARLSLEEYLSGSFRQEEEQMESAEFVAKENLRRAEEYLAYSKKLAAKGYLPEAQLEADQFAVEKARKELDLAVTKLEVLRVHSRKAKVNDLNASILTAEANLKSIENSYELESKKESEITEQIAKCVIYSPADGEVTYANRNQSGSSDGVLIEEGKSVRERQTIIRLPDTSHMRVFARVSETKVEQVKVGMPCSISITRDGFRGVVLNGEVESVSDYPVPSSSRYTAHIKEYATEILIENPPEAIKAGMSAKVTILADSMNDALLIPLSAVVRKEGRFYCLLKSGEEAMILREIQLGSSNSTHAVLTSGLKESDEVVINPDSFQELFESSSGSDFASR